ncbi:hypothetical protein CBS101457_002994 [Exobasidium rhododendri]|nr:hypothetical protein CBS101457_002994 [Exobasidium rhododendri]
MALDVYHKGSVAIREAERESRSPSFDTTAGVEKDEGDSIITYLSMSDLYEECQQISRQRHHDCKEASLSHDPRQNSPLAILFTSGSTGAPKAVQIDQETLVNVLQDNALPYAADDTFALCVSPTFDAWTFFAWTALLRGSTIVIYPGRLEDDASLADFFDTRQATATFLPTAVLTRIVSKRACNEGQRLRHFDRIRTIVTGGEALLISTARAFYKRCGQECRLWNAYGTVEACIVAALFPITRAWLESEQAASLSCVPIGDGLPGTTLSIESDEESTAKLGTGSLIVKGSSVSPGYFANDKETEKRFAGNGMGRSYDTGDLAYWIRLQDGTRAAVFAGRSDAQMKVRGKRVDGGEVEEAVSRVMGTSAQEVKVIASFDTKRMTQVLLAYFVSSEDKDRDSDGVDSSNLDALRSRGEKEENEAFWKHFYQMPTFDEQDMTPGADFSNWVSM